MPKRLLVPALVTALSLAALSAVAAPSGDTATGAKSYPREAFGFVALNVVDLEKSAEFYKSVIGLVEQRRLGEGNVNFVFLDVPGNSGFPRLALQHDKARKDPYTIGDAYSRCAFFVPDIEAIVTRATAAGIKMLMRTEDKGSRLKVAILKDPDGYSVELLQKY